MEQSYKKYFDINDIVESIGKYLPDFNGEKFIRAFEFAEKAHRGQLRKDEKTPYIVHPVKVVEILTHFHADEDTLISTLLHDVPEDTDCTLEEIGEMFGEKIAFLVDGITKLSKVYYRHNMPGRQIESLKKLFLHSSEDLRVILIKLADRLHNMRTLENIQKEEKRLRIARETLEIYVPIANLLGIQELKYQLEDLCFKYLFPPEYRQTYEKRRKSEKAREQASEKFIDILKNECQKQKIKVKIYDRKKNLYTIYKKICALGKTINDIDNRLSIRIIVDNVPNCYKVLGIVHSKFRPKNDRFRDYIATPKANGYQSLHTAIFGLDGLITEVQIRTEKMHIESEYGIAAGFFFDHKINPDQKRISWVNKILEIEKSGRKSDNFMESLKLDIFQDRIFVFTPKGEPVDLPKGAGVLDFAYAIHSELGNHALKASINGKEKNISTVLHTGDVVTVITSSKVTPDLSWLSFVKTSVGRNKILDYLKKISVEKRIKEGKRILQKEFDIAGFGLVDSMSFKKLNKYINLELGETFKDQESLFKAIGGGDLKASDVIRALQEKSPKIYEKGLRMTIKVVAKNRFGLMRDIAEVLYEHAGDIYAFKGWASKYEKDAYFTADILVQDFATISHIFDEIEQIEDVVYVYRLSRGAIWGIVGGSTFTALLWIFHPLMLSWMEGKSFFQTYPIYEKALVYGSLFLLVFMVLYLSNFFRKYFPYIRQRNLLWIVSFSIPVIAGLTLAIELLYFKLQLNWFVLLVETGLIYIYLLISFLSFRKSMPKT